LRNKALNYYYCGHIKENKTQALCSRLEINDMNVAEKPKRSKAYGKHWHI
jgi:hypothetical protein